VSWHGPHHLRESDLNLTDELQSGDVVADRYVILERIGRGGFGVVYRAIQRGINRHVALKVLRPRRAVVGVDLVERFRQEALHTSRLSHPNTITVIDYGETEEGLLYLVTEFLHGETLRARLRRERTLTPSSAVEIAKHVARSLGEAHAVGIVHGDVKPENIFLCRVAGEAHAMVKVLDFGIARLVGEEGEKAMGTPQYMSPEQFLREPLSPASDTYALGIILYEMVRGRRPFDGTDVAELFRRQVLQDMPDLPPKLASSKLGHVILRATAKQPTERYKSGMALAAALDAMRSPSRTPRVVFTEPDAGNDLHETLFSADAWEAATGALTTALGGQTLPTHGSRPPRLASSSSARDPGRSFVGRKAERDWLLERARAVHDGGGGAVIVLGGHTGVGKSRLVRWLQEEAPIPAGFACGVGRGASRGLFALADALAEALGVPRSGSDYALPKLVDRLDELLGTQPGAHQLDVFMGVFTGQPPPSRQVAHLLLEIAAKRPLLLHLDDAHAAGPEVTDLVEALTHLMGPVKAPLLLVLTLQREALCLEPPLGRLAVQLADDYPDRVHARAVGPLLRRDADVLARLVIETAASTGERHAVVGQRLLDDMAERTLLHPSLIEAQGLELLDRGWLVRGADGLALSAGAGSSLIIPRRLSEAAQLPLVFLRRHHPLGEEIHRLVHLLAVMGPEVPRDLLVSYATTAGGPVGELDQVLAALRRHDIVRRRTPLVHPEDEVRITFVWPVLQMALVDAVDAWSDATRLHRLAGAAKQVFWAQLGELKDHVDDIERHHARAQRLTRESSY
jgi:eukaryotic-like serine/threonine-protein kinase